MSLCRFVGVERVPLLLCFRKVWHGLCFRTFDHVLRVGVKYWWVLCSQFGCVVSGDYDTACVFVKMVRRLSALERGSSLRHGLQSVCFMVESVLAFLLRSLSIDVHGLLHSVFGTVLLYVLVL